MKIIIAPDSYKGSLSAVRVAKAIKQGIHTVYPHAETICLPVADGGEGTMETLVSATNGKIKDINVIGPLGTEVKASYGILGDEKTCVIEMATASGIGLVPKSKLAPRKTTTYGTGQLIKHALDDGYRSFILGIGGSATNDGGAGMLQALGLQILDRKGNEIGFGGGELHKIKKINIETFDPRIQHAKFVIASDVENPLIGPKGASYVFGPQKGASPEDIKLLDNNLTHWANEVARVTGVHLHDMPGAGAAGGLGGAFQAFFPSQMRRGIDVVLEYNQFHAFLPNTDLVITGEGKVDFQTASGKAPLGVAQTAQKLEIPTVIIAGTVGEGAEELYKYGVRSIHSLVNDSINIEKAIRQAPELLKTTAKEVVLEYLGE